MGAEADQAPQGGRAKRREEDFPREIFSINHWHSGRVKKEPVTRPWTLEEEDEDSKLEEEGLSAALLRSNIEAQQQVEQEDESPATDWTMQEGQEEEDAEEGEFIFPPNREVKPDVADPAVQRLAKAAAEVMAHHAARGTMPRI